MENFSLDYYRKLIKQAIHYKKSQGIVPDILHFEDYTDWKISENKVCWTDINLKITDKKSIWVFTYATEHAQELGDSPILGSCPEHIFSKEFGLDLFSHNKHITHDEVGQACVKFVKLLGPMSWMGYNIRFNEKHYGRSSSGSQYPQEKFFLDKRLMNYYNENNEKK